MVSAKEDKVPNTSSKEREGQSGSLKPMGPVEASQTPENLTVTGLPRDAGKPRTRRQVTGTGVPVCLGCSPQAVVDGWQKCPLRVPRLAHEPGVSISYIPSESTGSLSLTFRNVLADGGYLKGHTSTQLKTFQTYNPPKAKSLAAHMGLRYRLICLLNGHTEAPQNLDPPLVTAGHLGEFHSRRP